jgi:hypothetical protein
VPSRHSLREESDPTARAPFSPSTPYPPNLVEVLFSEVELPLNGVLGSSNRSGPTLGSVLRAQVFDSIHLHLLGEGRTLEFAEPVSSPPQPFDDAG